MNNIENAHVVVCDSAKFANQILRKREYTLYDHIEALDDEGEKVIHPHRRPMKKIPLRTFHFRVVLVDPPRCGLDKLTLSLVANYEHIIYISCCPDSLFRDLNSVRA